MNEPTFFLKYPKNPTSQIVCSFYATFQSKGKPSGRLKYHTGLTIETGLWDKSRQKISKKHKNSGELNRKLAAISAKITSIYAKAENDRANKLRDLISIEEMKSKLDAIYKVSKKTVKISKKYDFFHYFDEYLFERANDVVKHTEKSTIKKIKTLAHSMRLFCGRICREQVLNRYRNSYEIEAYCLRVNKDVYIDEIDMEFFTEYCTFCYRYLDYEITTMRTKIVTLKRFMKWCKKKHYTSNVEWINEDFSVPNFQPDKTSLSMQEIIKVLELDVDKVPKFDNRNARTKLFGFPTRHTYTKKDYEFMADRLNCKISEIPTVMTSEVLSLAQQAFAVFFLTAIRSGDYALLSTDKIEKIEGVKMVSLRMSKTKKLNKFAYIPIPPVVEKILIANNGTPPKIPTGNGINEQIRELCRLAGITNVIQVTSTAGNKLKTVEYFKFERVTKHIGRHSVNTNLKREKVSLAAREAIIGDTGDVLDKTYDHVEGQFLAVEAANTTAFTKDIKLKIK